MSQSSVQRSGWRGVSLVAIVYIYFLIFAQFSFLRRLAELGIANSHLKLVMEAMAIGGILLSLTASRSIFGGSPQGRIQRSLGVCGVAALLSLLPLSTADSIVVAFFIGAGLGLLTVTLATHLRLWLGEGNLLLKVGVGTGLGYFACNIPALFTASTGVQALASAVLCLIGIVVAAKKAIEPRGEPPAGAQEKISFTRVLLCFTALVWLDSAAFFIVQNTPVLKAGSWQGTAHLWANGLLHLAAAIASAWLLRRRGLRLVLVLAALALAVACLLLHDPSSVLLASIFYPIGVSLYSVALVAYPSLLAPGSSAMERARMAGLIYSVAGWFGSAMGIGMGQHLGQVPAVFVLLALVPILGPQSLDLLRLRGREVASTAVVLLVAFCIHRAILFFHSAPVTLTQIERGRQVYISEGCINCHSQYVRPNSPDVLMWGPVQTIAGIRSERPPLIGDRRQGPDLSQVGGRRSPLWLRAHFYDPRQINPASFMPSYAHLFDGAGTRGNDLIAYLSSLKSPEYAQHILAEQAWQPTSASIAQANAKQGAQLYSFYCATCHSPNGRTRQAWQADFRRLPPDLHAGPWGYIPTTDTSQQRERRIAQIVKFGIPGTDMPGHEYLSDREVASLSLWLGQSIAQPLQMAVPHTTPGENR